MTFLIIAFFAGMLTILAPCMLPVLPIIIGGSVQDGKPNKIKPLVITGSLALSIIIFTLILKASTALIMIPPNAWATISGGILIILGLSMLFQKIWTILLLKIGLSNKSEQILSKQTQKQDSYKKDILVGAALGPVFSSCSPTYFFILATVLPESFAVGILYLISYSLGLSLMLLLIAYLGQVVINKIRWAANPEGLFKKIIGLLFVLIGIFIIFGIDKKIETLLLDQDYLINIIQFEQSFLEN
jgi:cytochrome c-type biogenesis protein